MASQAYFNESRTAEIWLDQEVSETSFLEGFDYETDLLTPVTVEKTMDDGEGDFVKYPVYGAEGEPQPEGESHTTTDDLGAYTFTVRPEAFYWHAEIHEDKLKDDVTQQLEPRMRNVGIKAKVFIEKTLTEDLSANTWKTFDDVVLFGQHTWEFGKSHRGTDPSPITEINNDLVRSGSTLANLQTDYARCIAQLVRFTDDKTTRIFRPGQQIYIVYPSQDAVLTELMLEAFDSSIQSADTVSKITKGKAILLPNPYLTTDTEWFLFRSSAVTEGPLVIQLRLAPTGLRIWFDEKKDTWNFKYRMRFGRGVTTWQDCVRLKEA